MKPSKRTERVTIVFAPEEVQAVEEWRRQQASIPSRSEAIRALVQKGLSADRKR